MAGMVLGRTIIEYGRNPPLIIDSCGIPCPVCETREYYRTELSLLKQMGVAPRSHSYLRALYCLFSAERNANFTTHQKLPAYSQGALGTARADD